MSPLAALRDRRSLPSAAEETRILDAARGALAFDLRFPGFVPRGMRVVKFMHIPGLRDWGTLAFADRRNFGFRFVQRRASERNIHEELALTGDDHTMHISRVREYAIYTGKYHTEPIDGYYWAPTRRRVVWYEEDVRLEIEGIPTKRTPLEGLLHIADSSVPWSPSADLPTRNSVRR